MISIANTDASFLSRIPIGRSAVTKLPHQRDAAESSP
jgi:hypothetical protein